MNKDEFHKIETFMAAHFHLERRIDFFRKGTLGAIVLWVCGFFLTFGSVNNFKKYVAETRQLVMHSEEVQKQIEFLTSLPGVMIEILSLILASILSILLGYIIFCLATIIVDLILYVFRCVKFKNI